MTEKNKLGQGLSSLLGNKKNLSVLNNNEENINNTDIIHNIALDQIDRNLEQPRKYFDEKKLEDLENSIKEHGVIQPIIIKKKSDNRYEIISGERRFLASKKANLKTVPSIIKQNEDSNTDFVISIIENLQRADLNPIEEANAFKLLIDKYDFTQDQVAKQVGKSRAHITNILRLLLLPDLIQKYLIESKIDMGHARALINCPFAINIIDSIIENGLSVREVEKLVKSEKEYIKPLKKPTSKISEQKFTLLEKKMGYSCKINYNERNKKYHLSINFNSYNEMENFVKQF